MEWVLNAVLWIAELFDVRSTDPVLGAFKHARRAVIVCTVAQFFFLVLAFTFAPEGAVGVNQTTQLVEKARYLIGNGFALIAVACLIGMVWFAVRCLHIYFKPERYID